MNGDTVSDDTVHSDANGDADNGSLQEAVSPDGEKLRGARSVGEVLARVELDLAYSSEKLLNLDVLLMHVDTRENEYETLTMENKEISDDSVEKGLEFDFLSGILDSEVRELEKFIASLQPEIADVRENIYSYEHSSEAFNEMERKLHDSEESLEQSLNQVVEIRMQCDKFQRTLLTISGQETWNHDAYADASENGQFFNNHTKIKMQTAEQQRHILKMLEKSLARELDLEKKLQDSRNSEEELKLKLKSAEQEIFCMNEAAEEVSLRLFESENATQVLTGISKELMGHLQIVQFNLNGSKQREVEMESKLHSLEEINFDSGLEKVKLLEKQLRDSDIQLQHAKASAEASQEQQSLLYSAIEDMENLINDLKSKVVMAESKAENSEAKYTYLTETNLELNEEIRVLRGRMETLQASLHEADEERTATAKEINKRAKVISEMVFQLAGERERLHKQMSLLTKENKILVAKFWKGNDGYNCDREIFHKVDLAAGIGVTESKEAETESSAASFQGNSSPVKDIIVEPIASSEDAAVGQSIASSEDSAVGESKTEAVNLVQAKQLDTKYFLIPIIALIVSAVGVYLFALERA